MDSPIVERVFRKHNYFFFDDSCIVIVLSVVCHKYRRQAEADTPEMADNLIRPENAKLSGEVFCKRGIIQSLKGPDNHFNLTRS